MVVYKEKDDVKSCSFYKQNTEGIEWTQDKLD